MTFVIHHHEMGVYLGDAFDVGFWSKQCPVDDTAETFATEGEAYDWIDSWPLSHPDGIELIEVQTEPGQRATIADCVAAGLDAWK